MSRTIFLFGFLFCLGMLWGLSIPITMIAVSTGHSPLGMIFWQLLITVVILAAAAWWRGSCIIIDRAHLIFFASVTMLGTVVPNSSVILRRLNCLPLSWL